ncbi:MAG: omptin family outer membrane protease [Desulfomonile tiedjei]|nr:omptin family outer membrane protease [Desulfomonile tiedjei]
MVRRLAVWVAICVMSCLGVAERSESYIRGLQLPLAPNWAPDDAGRAYGHYCSLGIKKYLNSFTSYQFPNPFATQQDPLSRLEFPIDQWFMGIETSYTSRWWSLQFQGWMNVSRDGSLKMQDSDWDDEAAPDQKTIFSESKCRLNRGLLFDVRLSAATPLEQLINLRPVFGYRNEYFFFTTHDGFQAVLGGGVADLHGDGIEFAQSFSHYYVGCMLNTHLNGSGGAVSLPEIDLLFQADYAFITARNEDLHLLRSGERITRERTSGHCWHISLRATCMVKQTVWVGLDGDFKRLLTNGSHQLTNSLFNIDFSFGGSKVWSDQATISAFAEVKF